VINDPGVVATAEKVLKAAFGDKFIGPLPPDTPSEDYSEFINAGVPSCSSVSASMSRSASPRPARATARNCRPTTRPCSRRRSSRGLEAITMGEPHQGFVGERERQGVRFGAMFDGGPGRGDKSVASCRYTSLYVRRFRPPGAGSVRPLQALWRALLAHAGRGRLSDRIFYCLNRPAGPHEWAGGFADERCRPRVTRPIPRWTAIACRSPRSAFWSMPFPTWTWPGC